MHAIREVDRRRSGGQHAHFGARRVHQDLVAEDVGLHRLQEVLRTGCLLLPLDEVAEPGHALLVLVVALAGLRLVLPVCRDTVLSQLVHLVRADLHLEGSRVRAHDVGVQRLVQRLLRVSDVVIEAAGERVPGLVHDAERVVAIADGVDQHP